MTQKSLQDQLRALLPEGARVDAIIAFRDEVERFNRGRNLVSRSGGPALLDRLILESAAATRALPLLAGQKILDLGTGAGFPGIPFALARPVACSMLLLDRRPVACDFLRREIRALKIGGVEVLEGQSKELLRSRSELGRSFDWVLMKAVAPPDEALALARPFLAPNGQVVLFRDQAYRPQENLLQALPEGGIRWSWNGPLLLPGFEAGPDAPALHTFQIPA